MIYGYVRISTKKQSLERQIKNILTYNSEAKIISEVFTGTKVENRKEYQKLRKLLKKDDTLIFDSVSRMSRNAEEGINEYFDLMSKGINLIFLKEPYINTELYREQLKGYENIKTDDKDLEPLFKGIKKTLENLAKKQIVIAFEQSEKEVKDLSTRTSEALQVLKADGKKLGHNKKTLVTKKSIETKEKIKKISKKYFGMLNDKECIETLGITRNTFYKYVREIEGQKKQLENTN